MFSFLKIYLLGNKIHFVPSISVFATQQVCTKVAVMYSGPYQTFKHPVLVPRWGLFDSLGKM